MSVTVGQAKLKDAQKKLAVKWQSARNVWRDQAAERFGNDFIETVPPAVNSAMNAMTRLADLLATTKRDCQ